ncbi:MAG: hypothetical protein PHG07_08125 [Lachnospiraceae bacterium]|nr:hypothetical protein [Lachnospiraceae bacterium]
MKNLKCCPKCSSHNVARIPVICYVCCDCGYVENWVETQGERDEIKRIFG